MGTRGLVGVRFTGIDGKRKFFGSYNHFDSYPSGLGEEVVEFVKGVLQHPITIEHMYNNVKKIEWVDEGDKPSRKQINQLIKAGFIPDSKVLAEIKSMGANKSTKQRQDWYWTLRDYQGIGTFEAMFKGIPYLIDSSGFIKDSLFCEYAYVIDFDREVLEFYKGFQMVYGHINSYIEICEREDGSHFLDNDHRETRIENLENGMKRYISDGRRYAYGSCKKVGEKPFKNLEGWMKLFGANEDD